MLTRPLCGDPVHWRAEQSTWDGYRDAAGVAPLELHGLFELPDGPLACWLHILSFTDRDAAAVHFIAKAELRVPAHELGRFARARRAPRRARAPGLEPQLRSACTTPRRGPPSGRAGCAAGRCTRRSASASRSERSSACFALGLTERGPRGVAAAPAPLSAPGPKISAHRRTASSRSRSSRAPASSSSLRRAATAAAQAPASCPARGGCSRRPPATVEQQVLAVDAAVPERRRLLVARMSDSRAARVNRANPSAPS